MSDRLLVLVRHGQSEWNLKNLFTGWKDPDLTEVGIAEAREAGRKLKAQGLSFDLPLFSSLDVAALVLAVAAAIAIFRFNLGMLTVLGGSCVAGILLRLAGLI